MREETQYQSSSLVLQTAASRVITVDAVQTHIILQATLTPSVLGSGAQWLSDLPDGALWIAQKLTWAGFPISDIEDASLRFSQYSTDGGITDAVSFSLAPECPTCYGSVIIFGSLTSQAKFLETIGQEESALSSEQIYETGYIVMIFSQNTEADLANRFVQYIFGLLP